MAPTNDQVKLLASFSQLRPAGAVELCTALQIAQLSLKHRINKAGGQRIILFVGSPVKETTKELNKVGIRLKKNNVAVSVIVMGEVEENEEKMRAFVEKVNSNDNSHLVTVPAGTIPSDAIRSSPIMGEQMLAPGAAGDGGGGGGGMFEEYGGVDPALDPELAMALRASMLETRAAEEARAQAEAESGDGAAVAGEAAAAAATAFGGEDSADALTDEQAVELANRISLESPPHTLQGAAGTASGGEEAAAATDFPGGAFGGDDEEDELARAIALSMQEEQPLPPSAPGAGSGGADRDLAMDLLSGVGLDTSDPLVAAALAQLPAPPSSDEPAPKRSRDDDGGDDDAKK